MRDARALLADAARLYDEPGNGLQAASRAAARGGFERGAGWMRSALGVVRGSAPGGRARFDRLGVRKYGCASLAALLVLALPWRPPALALPAAIVAFYAVELRLVFVFPCALDGERAPFAASSRLVGHAGRSGAAAARLVRIAARMLFGGLAGRGFVRSWCIGCLAVLLWYEDARRAAGVAR
jgi:hypothetical protein